MSAPRPMLNIALVGFMGTGKSTAGRLAARELRFEFLDTDALIESRAGLRIADLFAQAGEPAFREHERRVVEELAALTRTVIATGGGMAANESNLASLKRHALVVCLWASPETIWERVANQTHRPLLQDPEPLAKIRQLLAEREKFYRQSDVLVNTEQRSLREVADQIVHQYRLAHGGALPS